MSYVICKHPAVRIDLLCKKEFWPKLVSDIQRCECTYEKEEQLTYEDGSEWVRLTDVTSLRGYELGALIGLFYGLEWGSVTRPNNGQEDKFYIMLNLRKRGKKNDQQAGS